MLLALACPASASAAPYPVKVPATDSSTEPWLAGVERAQDIELSTYPDGNLSPKRARELVRAVEGRKLRTLRFNRFEASAEALSVLVRAPGLERVSAIQLVDSTLSVDAFRALAGGAFRGVRFLNLNETQLRDDQLAVLADANSFANVEWLSLARNQLSATGVRSVVDSKTFANLRFLRLDGNTLGLEAATALANASLPKLTELSLRGVKIDDQALSALVTGALAKQLATLDLRDNPLTREGVGEVAGSGQVTLSGTPTLETPFRSAWDAGTIRAGGVAEELSGDVVAAYPEDLDALQGVRRLEGTLTVTDEVASLSALLNLEEIGGSLIIESTEKLKNLEGLGALERIGGDLVLSGNGGLSSLKGLEGLEELGGSLLIPSAKGAANPRLKTIAGLPALVRVNGSVVFQGAPKKSTIRKLAGFNALESIGGDLTLSGIEASKISPFPMLRSIGGDLELISSKRLAAINGFNSLTEVTGSFVIQNCGKLRKLSGMKVLARVGGDLRLCYPKRAGRALKDVEKRLSEIEVDGNTVTECE